ncbi:hypothetical protein HYH02_005930 [Chlamydomonas schloesseri]|uniref:Uncharacterized protein n=1 Tax=Chlamydomonas schloesseri TaxID=2026947 RepID=A0A836B6V1_9CHLO|nr:hypothetical protein HYH02_005930 [Chlamydomonas schloesseri]|eukprot:KAG2449183.1 hypothetical protein HYH02_005930 [Chlamydomonas schloesseri]
MAMMSLSQRGLLRACSGLGRGRCTVVPVRAVAAPEASSVADGSANGAASTSAPGGRTFRDGGSRRTQPGRGQGRRMRGGTQQQQQQQQPAAEGAPARRGAARAADTARWPEVAFLDDDGIPSAHDGPARPGPTARSMFRRHMAPAKATGNIIVRSLGRSGTSGAIKFLIALRREGLAAQPPVDVRVRVLKQSPIRGGFGAPLLMFVERVAAGTDVLPELQVTPAPSANTASAAVSGSEPAQPQQPPQQHQAPPSGSLQAALQVSRSGDPERLERALYKVVSGLQPGQFAAVDMVGPATLLLGLQSLVNVRTSIGIRGREVYFVPTITTQPLRQSAASPAAPPAGEQPAAEAEAEAAAPPAATADADRDAEPRMVEVVRMFVGRGAPVASASAALASAPATAHDSVQVASPAGSEQVASASGTGGSAGLSSVPAAEQVTVPLSELESLKSALDTMMQKQHQLEALLKDRQQQQQQRPPQ